MSKKGCLYLNSLAPALSRREKERKRKIVTVYRFAVLLFSTNGAACAQGVSPGKKMTKGLFPSPSGRGLG